MPHQPKGSEFYKTRITLPNGTTGLFACGTTNKEVAEDVERMVKTFQHDRVWAPLILVVEKRAKLARVYDAFKAGALDQFLANLSSPDLSPLVDEWPAKNEKYRVQVRTLIPEGVVFPASEFTKRRVTQRHDAAIWKVSPQRQAGLRDRAGGNRQWETEPDVGRVAHGVPARVDRLRALGNAVVPQVAEYIGRLIVEADKELRETA